MLITATTQRRQLIQSRRFRKNDVRSSRARCSNYRSVVDEMRISTVGRKSTILAWQDAKLICFVRFASSCLKSKIQKAAA